jgi:carbamoyl-phosphate synthase small subunit
MKGALILQDGTVVEGESFGARKEARGEVVFNTAMAGYQEYLTDPSYKYQILMPTYPLIGNYGVTPERFESDRVHVEGFVIRELCKAPSHGRLVKKLDDWLKEEGIPCLQGVDTRFLTRKIRDFGVMNGILSTDYDPKEKENLIEKARKMKSISEVDLVELVTVKKPVVHEPANVKRTVVLIDCGAKMSIVKSLVDRGCKVIRVPSNSTAKQVLDYDPDGMMISNGPGDPERATEIVKNIKKVIETQLPTFGICFGNQLVGRALGAGTYKLKFGHRGGNQPVKDLKTGKVYVTSQNHGFAVDGDGLPKDEAKVSHVNLNDNSVEGIRHKSLPLFTVQYHPEAHPGPWDNDYLFDEFMGLMDKRRLKG